MTLSTRLSLAVAIALTSALFSAAQAQTLPIDVTSDDRQAQFATQGQAREMRVEIYSPSGELVFEAESSGGQPIEWGMTDAKGERVADGVYVATITAADSAGKRRKRIEQITVGGKKESNLAVAAASSPAPAAYVPEKSIAPITGEGTAGKVAKFTGANAIGNSVIAENAGKVGVGTVLAPTATLQVNAVQPASSAAAGVNASPLLQTTGGAGGITTSTTAQAGAGASISLTAGNGGDAPNTGGKRGAGGSITLQPGSAGSKGAAGGANGNVF